jgi:hypothetical protein
MSQESANTAPALATNDASSSTDEGGGAWSQLPRSLKVGTLVVVIVVLAVIFSIWHDFYFHWFEVHTGTVNESGPYYGFWSGFGSDLGEATIFVAIVAAWRHHNCHVKGCPRIGRPVPGTPYVACPRHHPAHEGTGRGVSLETIIKAHEAAKRENRPQ